MEIIRRRIKKRKPRVTALTEEDIAKALRCCAGVQTDAGKMLGITQSAVSQRVSGSEYLKEIYVEIRNENLDLAESVLFKKIRDENLTAVIFYLKCVGKHRGYTEKTEVDISQTRESGVLVVPGVCDSVEEWLNSSEVKKTKEKRNAKSIH